jgi:8-oxo-dGTP diphosphatase
LVEHRNAGLWLPTGGHVEPDEHPATAAERECREELGIEARFWRREPPFVTSIVTVGSTAGHSDVSLWYVLEGNASEPVDFDAAEFASVRWFGFDEIPWEKSDPQMKRFVNKLKQSI